MDISLKRNRRKYINVAWNQGCLEGITIGGKTLREYLEVINHQGAILYVEEIIKDEKPLSEWQIKNIHRLVLKGIDDLNVGVYRQEQVFISCAEHVPPEAILFP